MRNLTKFSASAAEEKALLGLPPLEEAESEGWASRRPVGPLQPLLGGGQRLLSAKLRRARRASAKRGGLLAVRLLGGGGGSGLSSLLGSSALLSNLPADSSDSEEEDQKSQKSESKTSVSAFSFKSGSSAGSGGSAVKSAGGFSLKPKMGLPNKSSLVGGGGGSGGGGGLQSLLKGGQWSTATPVDDGQADEDFDF